MVLNGTMRRRRLLGLGAAPAALVLIWFGMQALTRPIVDLADANDNAKVLAGRHSYRLYCSSCHGHLLQGQALWQIRDKDAYKRAPAHDESGHTRQHSDEELFKNRLTDDHILAIIALIKRGWPIGLRASQATLNPGYAGMPAEASRVACKFPPTCRAALEQRGVKSVDQTLAPGPGLLVEGFGERP
jgi:mono/diheme cytochrome c family protein